MHGTSIHLHCRKSDDNCNCVISHAPLQLLCQIHRYDIVCSDDARTLLHKSSYNTLRIVFFGNNNEILVRSKILSWRAHICAGCENRFPVYVDRRKLAKSAILPAEAGQDVDILNGYTRTLMLIYSNTG